MMETNLSANLVLEKIENETFLFKRENSYSIQQIDLINSVISGEVDSMTILSKHNFIETAISNLNFYETNLEACDFIDCSIENSRFTDCNMTGAHINSSIIKNSKFISCINTLTNFNKSDFYEVVFENCDFSRLLIKDCKFYNCQFINCKTTNKIFESCIIFNSIFANMEIQIQTIFDNMGIIKNNFNNVTCRTARTTETYELIDLNEIKDYATNNLQILNSLFFLDSAPLENWYSQLYDFLESDSFYNRKKTPESLMNFLEKLSEFLILLYENNIICLHPLIKFHYFTSLWTEKLEITSNTNNNIYKTLIGLHMIHTRYVQNFLAQLYIYLDGEFESISLILKDDYINDKKYYIEKLNSIFNINENNIIGIKPYNSVELITFFSEYYQYTPMLAIILSTKLKFNVESLNNQLYLTNTDQQIQITENHSKVFNLEIGRGSSKDVLFALKMQAISPNNLLINLALDLNGKKVFQVYNYIIKIFKNLSQNSL